LLILNLSQIIFNDFKYLALLTSKNQEFSKRLNFKDLKSGLNSDFPKICLTKKRFIF